MADLPQLRTDGLYMAIPRDERSICTCIRFYPDGRVVSAAVSMTLHTTKEALAPAVARWLADEPPASTGRYALQGVRLRFTTAYPDADGVEYGGTLRPDGALELHSHSHINGHRRHETYTFVEVPFAR